jgi:hypothetical protein
VIGSQFNTNSKPKPSLTPSSTPLPPPRPKPFDMTEPHFNQGLWSFWLTAEPPVLTYVSHLPCVLQQAVGSPFLGRRPTQHRQMFTINPRYDYQEAWLWIYQQLDSEAREVELNDVWEGALTDADDEDDSYNGPF